MTDISEQQILIMWRVKLRRLKASIILLLIIPAILSLEMKTKAEDWESYKLITTPTIIFEADNIKTELELWWVCKVGYEISRLKAYLFKRKDYKLFYKKYWWDRSKRKENPKWLG